MSWWIAATSAWVARLELSRLDLLVGQHFGLLLGKAVLGQPLDEPMGVKGNRFGHGTAL